MYQEKDFFGEVGMVLGEQRSATIKANNSTELLELDVDAFFEVAAEVPEFAKALQQVSALCLCQYGCLRV